MILVAATIATTITRAGEVRIIAPSAVVPSTASTIVTGRTAELAPVGFRGSEPHHKNNGENNNDQNPLWHGDLSEKLPTHNMECWS
jgi:hypothetical protein